MIASQPPRYSVICCAFLRIHSAPPTTTKHCVQSSSVCPCIASSFKNSTVILRLFQPKSLRVPIPPDSVIVWYPYSNVTSTASIQPSKSPSFPTSLIHVTSRIFTDSSRLHVVITAELPRTLVTNKNKLPKLQIRGPPTVQIPSLQRPWQSCQTRVRILCGLLPTHRALSSQPPQIDSHFPSSHTATWPNVPTARVEGRCHCHLSCSFCPCPTSSFHTEDEVAARYRNQEKSDSAYCAHCLAPPALKEIRATGGINLPWC